MDNNAALITTGSKFWEYVVTRSNSLITASYSLSLTETRLLEAFTTLIDSFEEHGQIQELVITTNDYKEIYHSDSSQQNIYRDLKEATQRLMRREPISIKISEGKTLESVLVSSAIFDENERTITLSFPKELRPFLTGLRGGFSSYKLKYVHKLPSTYAFRIYSLINMWIGQNKKQSHITVDQLRDILDLGDKYKRFAELRRSVIEPSIEAINRFTDFELEASYTKKGRSFHNILFRFNQNEKAYLEKQQNALNWLDTSKHVKKFSRVQEIHYQDKAPNTKEREEWDGILDGTPYVHFKNGKEYIKQENGALNLTTNEVIDWAIFLLQIKEGRYQKP